MNTVAGRSDGTQAVTPRLLTERPAPFDRIGGRRFFLVWTSCLGYTALLVGAYIDMNVYFNLQVMTVGAYIAGNGLQKYAEMKHARNGN